MTTCDSENIFNIAVKGNFDDCQRIVKQMFNDEKFREEINMSGVNSINWARIFFKLYIISMLTLNFLPMQIFPFQLELWRHICRLCCKKWAYL